jgi:hypothetical protein
MKKAAAVNIEHRERSEEVLEGAPTLECSSACEEVMAGNVA